MRMIEAHNQEAALGMHSYEMAMNHLGDMVSLHYEVLPQWQPNQQGPDISFNLKQFDCEMILILYFHLTENENVCYMTSMALMLI